MSTMVADELQRQIDEGRNDIHADQYAMSIGELASLYREGELLLSPEYQRYFRWTPSQRTRLIESILLGIPLPSVFVAQLPDGKWEVVDGLQRLSTVFELMGILRDEEGKLKPPLQLTRAPYLPALEGHWWNDKLGEPSLSITQQLLLKRAKMDVKIILRESEAKAKYEMFQRLNTGGTFLSDQEVRNAMLVAVNRPFHHWLNVALAEHPAFVECLGLTEDATLQGDAVEMALRFVVFRTMPADGIKFTDLGDFLTERMVALGECFEGFKDAEESAFKRTFDRLAEIGPDALRRFDMHRNAFAGPFLKSAFEGVALGLGHHADNPLFGEIPVLARIKALWANPTFTPAQKGGRRANSRIPTTIREGRAAFAP